jgi:hypothetical protein
VRSEADNAKIEDFMAAVGRHAAGEGAIYLGDGATAALYGWRLMTIGVDLKPDWRMQKYSTLHGCAQS